MHFQADDPRKFTPEEIREVMRSEQSEVFSQLFAHSHAAAKGTILLNGGAAVAVLAFLGQVLSKEGAPGAMVAGAIHMVPALLSYLIGAFAGGLVAGTAYISQSCYAVQFWVWQGYTSRTLRLAAVSAPWLRLLSVLCFAVSMGAFFYGGYRAAEAMDEALTKMVASPA